MTAYDHDDAALARAYDRISDHQFEGGKRLLERLGIGAGDRVLDLGCGTGRLARFIADRVGPTGGVVGVDPLPERIALARQSAPALRFEVGSAENLGVLPEASFDAVCINAVFHWIDDKPRALAEVRRVLRPGGRVGVTTSPKELHWQGTLAGVCGSVLTRSPYLGALQPSALEVMTRQVGTSEALELLVAQQLEVVELHIVRREQRFASGADVVDFANASSFGNFANLVPEELRPALRNDITAAFDALGTPDGIVVRQLGMLLVAERGR